MVLPPDHPGSLAVRAKQEAQKETELKKRTGVNPAKRRAWIVSNKSTSMPLG